MENRPYEIIHLKNNLRVLLYPRSDIHSVFFGCCLAAGSINDPVGKNGMAHLMEHLVLEQTDTRNKNQLAVYQESLCGSFNATTFDEMVKIEGNFHYLSLSKALNLLKEVVFGRNFDNAILNESKGIIYEEFEYRSDDPKEILSDEANKVRYRDFPSLSSPIVGSRESVKKITLEEIRSYYAKFYNPENAVLIIAGKFNRRWVIEEVGELFTNIQNNPQSRVFPSYDVDYTEKLIKIIKKPYSAIFSALSFPSLKRKATMKERLTKTLLLFVLHGLDSSRIFKLLRNEKNIIYDISVDDVLRKNYGIAAVVWNVSARNYMESLKCLFDEINKTKQTLISDAELNHFRNYLNRDNDKDFDDLYYAVEWMVEDLFYHGQIYMPEDLRKIRNKITAHDLQQMAKNIFDFAEANLVVIGNTNDLDKRELLRYLN